MQARMIWLALLVVHTVVLLLSVCSLQCRSISSLYLQCDTALCVPEVCLAGRKLFLLSLSGQLLHLRQPSSEPLSHLHATWLHSYTSGLLARFAERMYK